MFVGCWMLVEGGVGVEYFCYYGLFGGRFEVDVDEVGVGDF